MWMWVWYTLPVDLLMSRHDLWAIHATTWLVWVQRIFKQSRNRRVSHKIASRNVTCLRPIAFRLEVKMSTKIASYRDELCVLALFVTWLVILIHILVFAISDWQVTSIIYFVSLVCHWVDKQFILISVPSSASIVLSLKHTHCQQYRHMSMSCCVEERWHGCVKVGIDVSAGPMSENNYGCEHRCPRAD